MSTSTQHQSPAKPIPLALRLVYTLVPFIVYLLARQFSLPTKTVLSGADPRNWSDSNHVLAVGITPWLIAAVFVEIFGRIIPHWKRPFQPTEAEYANLRRIMNIIGLVFAVMHAAWITFDLTYIPSSMIAPPEEFYFPSENEASPLIVFASLLTGALVFKTLCDACVPRSSLQNHGWVIAALLLLASVVALVRQSSSYALFFDVQDLVRIAVHLLVCGMLVAFLLVQPFFVWRPATQQNLLTPHLRQT